MEKTEDEIRSAVEQCLKDCYGQSSPVVKVAECVEELRASGWEQADIRRVESLVLKVLAALLSPQDGPNEPEQRDLT